MARQFNDRVDDALRGVASLVASEDVGRWRLLRDAGGHTLSALVGVRGEWLELTAQLPESAPPVAEDLLALRVNSRLRGPTRVARHFGERDPHLRAEVSVEHLSDVSRFIETAWRGVTDAVHHLVSPDGSIPPSVERPALSLLADVEHACKETGWRAICTDSNVRVELVTRAGVFNARLDSSFDPLCLVVELVDLSDQPDVSRRAIAALLMAASSSFRLVKGGLVERDGTAFGALICVPADASGRAVDIALSALATAGQATAREAQALLDTRLALDYLALSHGKLGKRSVSLMEETCLQ